MKALALFIALVAFLCGQSFAAKPNVLIVLVDDAGFGDFGCHGHPFLKTPHLDRLHGESVRLTDFHVAPMCSPTRGQLLTGCHGLRNGVTSVTAGRTFLRPEFVTAPQMFAAAGWRTGTFGKWHLGDSFPHRPMDKGFQDAVWTHVTHDLTAYKSANMQIRFGFDIDSSGVFTVSGWNIDDVVIANAICN